MLRKLERHLIEIIFLFIFLNTHFFTINGYDFIYAGCSQEKYTPNSLFATNLNSLLSSITTSAPQSLYNNFDIGNDIPEGAVYGLYQCRGDLKTKECSTCIASAVSQIGSVCPYTNGAALQLDGCFIRYQHSDFLGMLDTSVSYKKCSKSRSNDGEFLRRRDEVFEDLKRAIGFRVSSSGDVEGYAQCLGDIGATDCSSCLSDAAMKVKSLCGSSQAADLFLSQCYLRYWSSGYFVMSTGSSHEHDVAKTVATIVAVAAVVAAIVLFIAFCRKAFG